MSEQPLLQVHNLKTYFYVETLYNIKGMVPSPKEYPKGCRFCPRCPYAAKLCQDKQPPLTVMPDGRKVRCWKYDEQEGKNFE